MKHAFQRTARLAAMIQKEVGEILSREIKDPRMQHVTISHVRVAKDMRSARIFFTALDTGKDLKATLDGLKQASGFVQSRIAARLQLRQTPHITFEYDPTVVEGLRMDKLLQHIEQELHADGQAESPPCTE